jgi:hypothetical protein
VGIEKVKICTRRTLYRVQGEEYQRKIFIELLNTQEEDLCKECTRPTLRQNVERSHLKAQWSVGVRKGELVQVINLRSMLSFQEATRKFL